MGDEGSRGCVVELADVNVGDVAGKGGGGVVVEIDSVVGVGNGMRAIAKFLSTTKSVLEGFIVVEGGGEADGPVGKGDAMIPRRRGFVVRKYCWEEADEGDGGERSGGVWHKEQSSRECDGPPGPGKEVCSEGERSGRREQIARWMGGGGRIATRGERCA